MKSSCNYQSNLESVHQVPITAGWPEAMWIQSCPRLLHQTGASGIEPRTPISRVPCLNCSATCSTWIATVVKVKVIIYSPIFPKAHRTLHKLPPGIRTQSHLPGENAALFLQLKPFTPVHFFSIPPGTHYCWVARGGVDSKLGYGFYITSAVGIEPQTP